MNSELEALCQKAAESSEILKQGKNRIKELENQLKNADQIRDQQLKSAPSQIIIDYYI